MKTIKMLMVMAIIMFIATMASAGNAIKGKVGDSAWRNEIKEEMARPIVPMNSADVKNADIGKRGLSISLKDSGDKVIMTLTGVRLVPKDDPKAPSVEAKIIRIKSAIKDIVKGKENSAIGDYPVKNGVVEITLDNYAKINGVCTVEKFYGVGLDANGKEGHLMLDPNDSYVIYEKDPSSSYVAANGDHVNLGTLAAAAVYHKAAPTEPLKKALNDKGITYTNDYIAGPHPELEK